MDMITDYEQIIARGERAGLSEKELCERAGIAQSTPWRWRRGDVMPNFRSILRLNRAVEKYLDDSA